MRIPIRKIPEQPLHPLRLLLRQLTGNSLWYDDRLVSGKQPRQTHIHPFMNQNHAFYGQASVSPFNFAIEGLRHFQKICRFLLCHSQFFPAQSQPVSDFHKKSCCRHTAFLRLPPSGDIFALQIYSLRFSFVASLCDTDPWYKPSPYMAPVRKHTGSPQSHRWPPQTHQNPSPLWIRRRTRPSAQVRKG